LKTTNELDELIAAEVEQSELTRDDVPPVDARPTRPNRGNEAPYSVRLPAGVKDQLDRVAKDLDVPTGTLVRGYILQGLKADLTAEHETMSVLIDRIDNDMAKLRRLIK
jgi:hypothetical protein